MAQHHDVGLEYFLTEPADRYQVALTGCTISG